MIADGWWLRSPEKACGPVASKVRSAMCQASLKPVWKLSLCTQWIAGMNFPLHRTYSPAAQSDCIEHGLRLQCFLYRNWRQLVMSGCLLDLFSRKVVGWTMFQNMPADLVCVALRRVIQLRRPPLRLIVHSDINRKVDKKMPLNVANRGKGFNLLKGRG